MPYYMSRAAAERQAYAAQAAALARQKYLWERARAAQSLLASADYAYQNGEVFAASRLYGRLATFRPPSQFNATAKGRLTQMADDARRKLKEVDAKLEGQEVAPDLIESAFQEYTKLGRDYDGVAVVRREIKTHIAKQRSRPEYLRVLNEPEAKALWELGRKHEGEDHPCCAYWVYQKAAQLTPAPSAQQALEKYSQMKQNPDVIASAKACRELQECHALYDRAERVVGVNPARARELFNLVADRAPKDSELYLAARKQILEAAR